MLKKYFSIISVTWQRALAYRFTIISYRIGEIAEMLFLIIMWSALYAKQPAINGFTLPEMITYILVGNLIGIITRNFMSDIVAKEIKDGTLSLFVVKPLTYFNYVFIREIGRVSFPLALSVVTQVAVMATFYQVILINRDLLVLGTVFLMVILAFVFELLLSFLIAMVAFWTDEVTGLQTAIDRLKKFIAGGYFPLSLLPVFYLKISLALPFAYSFYVPTLLYLNKLSLGEAVKGLAVQIAWIVILYGLVKIIWKRGAKKYEGVGI